MFQNYLRLSIAFIFFINIFTPSLLQAQRYSKRGEKRELPTGSLPTSVSRRKYQENHIIHQDNTRVKSSFSSNRNIPQKNSLQRETLSFHHDRSIDKTLDPQNTSTPQIASEIDSSYISVTNRPSHIHREQRTSPIEHQFKRKKSFAETYDLYFEYGGGGRITDLRNNASRDVHLMVLWDPRLFPAEEKILTHAGARNYYNKLTNPSEFSEVICNDSRLIWSAIKILRRRAEEAANYDRDQFTGKPLSFAEKQKRYQQDLWLISETAGGGAWTDGPITPRENMKDALGRPLTSEKDIVKEMFINDDLDIGWIKSFLSGERDPRFLEYRKYFIDEHAMPGFVKKWFEGYLEEINNDSFDPLDPRHYRASDIITRYFYRDSSKTQTAEAALYFMDLLDLKEYKSLTQEEQDIVHQEFLEVEEILKQRLYSINGKTWEDVNARGAIRLALWNLYKFYYLTGMKETSGMEAPLDELLEGMGIGFSYYKHTGFSYPNEYYKPEEIFPLAAKGSYGDQLCREAIEDAKSVDGTDAYHTALEYATLLLMQAKGNILPLMRYVDQAKWKTDLTDPVVQDSAVVLQTAASQAYYDPFKLSLFICALRILSAPNEFSMRTRISAVEHAFSLYRTQDIPALADTPAAEEEVVNGEEEETNTPNGLRKQLEKDKDFFLEMIGKLYCHMLGYYKSNDSFGLDSDNFAKLVSALSEMYIYLYTPGGAVLHSTGSSAFDNNMDNENLWCEWGIHRKILENKKVDELEEFVGSFVLEAGLWIVGGWAVGAIFKGAGIVVRSTWGALKSTPKAAGAFSTARKGRKLTAAVIEYKKAYRYNNYVRNASKNSQIVQSYTRRAAAGRPSMGTGTKGAKVTAQNTPRTASAPASQTQPAEKALFTETTTSTATAENATPITTKAVTKKSQLIYSDWNPFKKPKQLTALTRTEYLPYQQQARVWNLTDESISLFNTKRGIVNYDVLRKMRGVDQFGNTRKFFQPLPTSRTWAFNPIVAHQELDVMTKYIQNGGIKDLNLWGLSKQGELLQLTQNTDKTLRFSRVFIADKGFTNLALKNPTTFMDLASYPAIPTRGIIAEVNKFGAEDIAFNFLQKGYGLSGKTFLTQVLKPKAPQLLAQTFSPKRLLTAEWNYIKHSWEPTLQWFGFWEVGNIFAAYPMQRAQEKAQEKLQENAKKPYFATFDEANDWAKASEEYQKFLEKTSWTAPSIHLANDLLDNNTNHNYFLPGIAHLVGNTIDYVDIWPLNEGGKYLKIVAGTEFSDEHKKRMSSLFEHSAWENNISTNRIKRSYKKQVKTLYKQALESIDKDLSADEQKELRDLAEKYHEDLLKAIEKPETLNNTVKITEKFYENRSLLIHKSNLEDFMEAASPFANQSAVKDLTDRLNTSIQDITSLMAANGPMSEEEREEKLNQFSDLTYDATFILSGANWKSAIDSLSLDPNDHAVFTDYIDTFVKEETKGINTIDKDVIEKKRESLKKGIFSVDFLLSQKKMLELLRWRTIYIPSFEKQEEFWNLIEEQLDQIEILLKNPNNLTDDKKAEIENAFLELQREIDNALYTIPAAEEDPLLTWRKDAQDEINSVRIWVNKEISSWKNRDAIKGAMDALYLFTQEVNAIIEKEGISIEGKNIQIKAAYAELQKTLRVNLYIEQTSEELLPESETDLNTQAY